MRRVAFGLVGVFLLTGLAFGAHGSRAAAMNSSSGMSGSSCSSSFPAPYTGGAGVVKFFHMSDGSTVTITSTGAVIKQGRCGNPYREGWVNMSDFCSINTAQDLSGKLSSGSSNPNGSGSFSGCSTSNQTSNSPQKPQVTIINNNSQSQSQSQAGPGTQATASASTSSAHPSSTATTQVKAATTTTAAAQSTPAVYTLPNTGAGSAVALFAGVSVLGTLGHILYSRRVRL
jgi:LPXTG-motif cell wall-anchored protein